MTTFTLRVSGLLAARLSSVQMRYWLAEFLRRPGPLPRDPGPGRERISLTLPAHHVRNAANYLRCSPSEALRRLALEAIQPLPPVFAAQSKLEARSGIWYPQDAAPRTSLNQDQDLAPMTGQKIGEAIISALIPLLATALLIFLSSRKEKREKGNMTT